MIFKRLGGTDQRIPAVGLGTGVGPYGATPRGYQSAEDVVRLGVELGMTLVDTAPVYGDGVSEELVGRAVRGQRERVFLATKLSPENATFQSVLTSAAESLRRLETDHIDLYQVHWSNPTVPIAETLSAMSQLVQQGKVRHIGVSNFSLSELKAAEAALPDGRIRSLQVEYNLFDRTIERELLPYCEQQGITVIAYSPLHRGQIAAGPQQIEVIRTIAKKHDATMAQVALRWIITRHAVVAIPNTTNLQRVRENAASAELELDDGDLAEIDRVCRAEPTLVPTDRIRVVVQPGQRAYQTIEEAIDNPFNLVPSPAELAEQIGGGEFLKPVRVAPAQEPSPDHDYTLLEGRVRYWAWVIAHRGKEPIPVLVDELANG